MPDRLLRVFVETIVPSLRDHLLQMQISFLHLYLLSATQAGC